MPESANLLFEADRFLKCGWVNRFGDVEMADLIVERCRRVREELLRQYGGLEGLFRKLETMDREREESRRAHRRRRGRTGRNPPPKGRVAKKA